MEPWYHSDQHTRGNNTLDTIQISIISSSFQMCIINDSISPGRCALILHDESQLQVTPETIFGEQIDPLARCYVSFIQDEEESQLGISKMVKVATKNIIKETKKMELGTAKQIQHSRIKKACRSISFNHCQNFMSISSGFGSGHYSPKTNQKSTYIRRHICHELL